MRTAQRKWLAEVSEKLTGLPSTTELALHKEALHDYVDKKLAAAHE